LEKVSETYFQALRNRDFKAIPFSDNIVFRAPLAPGGSKYPIKGKEELLDQWWKPLEPALDGIQINVIDHFYNESLTQIITRADITIAALGVTLRVADRFTVNESGEISEQENHFDASPMKSPIHHNCLRSMDFSKTKEFYREVLKWPLVMDQPELIIFLAGSVFIAFKKADPRDTNFTTFSPYEVGLDHIAITCEREEELHALAKKLADAGIENTGVKIDSVLNKPYCAFKDPDRIAWELYMK
ncbi:VOC family protein, partial [Aquiflexum sp.]|uniref:VOC family protein n=1 Tax=Aquiflexum sp. TaxID=1872584 RepID=UPI003593AA11